MPLTAYDPESNRIILPGDFAAQPQCRDPQCRANLHDVRGTLDRVAHFRHSTSSACPSKDAIREKESMCPWHMEWQQECADPARIEYTHTNPSGDRRRADIITKYGWCIEVQHSGIAAKTIQARQNHWGGRVLWLVDAASEDRSVDLAPGNHVTRLSGPWVHHLTTLIAVDDGEFVTLFPATGVHRDSRELTVRTMHTQLMTRVMFCEQYINGDVLPWSEPPQTDWVTARAKLRTQQRLLAQEREAEARRKQAAEIAAGYECEYVGNPDRLIHEPIVVEMPLEAVNPVVVAAPPVVDPEPEPDIVVDLRAAFNQPPQPSVLDWRKSDRSQHPVVQLPAHYNERLTCQSCGYLTQDERGRWKCYNWPTSGPASDITPEWLACRVWIPRQEQMT